MNDYLILFAIFIVFFFRIIFCGYVVDDEVWNAKLKGHLDNFKSAKKDFKYFKGMLWMGLYGAGIFNNPVIEHLFNAILHFAVSALILKATGSFMVALLYMINPVMNQTALWLNGRRYLVCTLCCIAAWCFPIAFIPLYAFSAWIHVSGVMLPVMILFTDLWWMVIAGVALGGTLGYKKMIKRYQSRKVAFAEDNELQRLTPKKAIIVIKSLGYYFFHGIFPNKPRMYHEFLYYFSCYENGKKEGYSFNFEFFKGLAVVAFLIYEIFWQKNIWAIWFAVFQLQYCNILTVIMNASDRYMCISNIGLMATLVKYMNMIPEPYRTVSYTVLITFYFMKYQPLFRAYRTKEDFYKYHINLQPDGVDARENLANHYIAHKRLYSAFHVVQDGLRERHCEFNLMIKMSEILIKLGRPQEALDIMIKSRPYARIGELEALDQLIETIQKKYDNLKKDQANKVVITRGNHMNRKQRRAAKKE